MKNEKIVEAEIISEEKPYFFPRLIAYVIDMFLVTVLITLILMIIPGDKNHNEYVKEFEIVQKDYIEEKISDEEYINKSKDLVYDMDYTSIPSIIVKVTIYIGYFIVLQYFNKGQTLGKKVMKLRVVSTSGDELSDSKHLTINQVAIRSLLIDSIATNMLILGLLLFVGRNYYFHFSFGVQAVMAIVIVVTLFMIFIRKDGKGLHDIVANTKVVSIK